MLARILSNFGGIEKIFKFEVDTDENNYTYWVCEENYIQIYNDNSFMLTVTGKRAFLECHACPKILEADFFVLPTVKGKKTIQASTYSRTFKEHIKSKYSPYSRMFENSFVEKSLDGSIVSFSEYSSPFSLAPTGTRKDVGNDGAIFDGGTCVFTTAYVNGKNRSVMNCAYLKLFLKSTGFRSVRKNGIADYVFCAYTLRSAAVPPNSSVVVECVIDDESQRIQGIKTIPIVYAGIGARVSEKNQFRTILTQIPYPQLVDFVRSKTGLVSIKSISLDDEQVRGAFLSSLYLRLSKHADELVKNIEYAENKLEWHILPQYITQLYDDILKNDLPLQSFLRCFYQLYNVDDREYVYDLQKTTRVTLRCRLATVLKDVNRLANPIQRRKAVKDVFKTSTKEQKENSYWGSSMLRDPMYSGLLKEDRLIAITETRVAYNNEKTVGDGTPEGRPMCHRLQVIDNINFVDKYSKRKCHQHIDACYRTIPFFDGLKDTLVITNEDDTLRPGAELWIEQEDINTEKKQTLWKIWGEKSYQEKLLWKKDRFNIFSPRGDIMSPAVWGSSKTPKEIAPIDLAGHYNWCKTNEGKKDIDNTVYVKPGDNDFLGPYDGIMVSCYLYANDRDNHDTLKDRGIIFKEYDDEAKISFKRCWSFVSNAIVVPEWEHFMKNCAGHHFPKFDSSYSSASITREVRVLNGDIREDICQYRFPNQRVWPWAKNQLFFECVLSVWGEDVKPLIVKKLEEMNLEIERGEHPGVEKVDVDAVFQIKTAPDVLKGGEGAREYFEYAFGRTNFWTLYVENHVAFDESINWQLFKIEEATAFEEKEKLVFKFLDHCAKHARNASLAGYRHSIADYRNELAYRKIHHPQIYRTEINNFARWIGIQVEYGHQQVGELGGVKMNKIGTKIEKSRLTFSMGILAESSECTDTFYESVDRDRMFSRIDMNKESVFYKKVKEGYVSFFEKMMDDEIALYKDGRLTKVYIDREAEAEVPVKKPDPRNSNAWKYATLYNLNYFSSNDPRVRDLQDAINTYHHIGKLTEERTLDLIEFVYKFQVAQIENGESFPQVPGIDLREQSSFFLQAVDAKDIIPHSFFKRGVIYKEKRNKSFGDKEVKQFLTRKMIPYFVKEDTPLYKEFSMGEAKLISEEINEEDFMIPLTKFTQLQIFNHKFNNSDKYIVLANGDEYVPDEDLAEDEEEDQVPYVQPFIFEIDGDVNMTVSEESQKDEKVNLLQEKDAQVAMMERVITRGFCRKRTIESCCDTPTHEPEMTYSQRYPLRRKRRKVKVNN